MKTFTLATLSGLVAVVLAAAVPEEASSDLAKKADDTIYITLCNDFHGGKPCQKKPITPGKCSTSNKPPPPPRLVAAAAAAAARYQPPVQGKKRNFADHICAHPSLLTAYVDNLGRGYVSSVSIPNSTITCEFYR